MINLRIRIFEKNGIYVYEFDLINNEINKIV